MVLDVERGVSSLREGRHKALPLQDDKLYLQMFGGVGQRCTKQNICAMLLEAKYFLSFYSEECILRRGEQL